MANIVTIISEKLKPYSNQIIGAVVFVVLILIAYYVVYFIDSDFLGWDKMGIQRYTGSD